jgi:hypothetical protein
VLTIVKVGRSGRVGRLGRVNRVGRVGRFSRIIRPSMSKLICRFGSSSRFCNSPGCRHRHSQCIYSLLQ